ncbi:hypothetical protein HELRODRAFT_166296 [Helobdella robusta]|uniref:Ubiquitin-like domain-containing protein n=1 Tax=Helobdella robusta TaxID=6412 RepID=T1EY00_HELRO|nr:hypothetical protein HELRODRAFT_166296 [Helobdella robusta]ESN90604.1 hypothetical protein HELRODRAFT_166296 [Helobdella robusta]
MTLNSQTVHFTLRRQRTTIFLNIDEEKTILELKQLISKAIKLAPEKFKLYRENMLWLDKGLGEMKKKLKAVGYSGGSTRPDEPAILYLCFLTGYNRQGRAVYESVDVVPYSLPRQSRAAASSVISQSNKSVPK